MTTQGTQDRDTRDLAPGTRVTTRLYGKQRCFTAVQTLLMLNGDDVYQLTDDYGIEIIQDASELEVADET